jgi:hypothetical protein
MLMVYEPEFDRDGAGGTESTEGLRQHERFVQFLRERGVAFSGAALQASTAATTLRCRGHGETSLSDGPYAELPEPLSGYYIIDVPDLDEALNVARRCPVAGERGGVEVRPLWDTGTR